MLRGLSYPLSLNGGNLAIDSEYPKLVRNAIFSGLLTQEEERVMRPEYGLEPPEFKTVTDVVANLQAIKSKLAIALEGYPDVDFELRGAINEDGRMDVIVIYQVSDETPTSLSVTL